MLENRPSPLVDFLGGLAVYLGIVSIVAATSYERLAGSLACEATVAFHHLDFFVMGPSLRYLNGGALGTEVYSQYGVAWPIIFSACSPIFNISYDHVLRIFVLYGTLYFAGVYLSLRLFSGSLLWGAVGAYPWPSSGKCTMAYLR